MLSRDSTHRQTSGTRPASTSNDHCQTSGASTINSKGMVPPKGLFSRPVANSQSGFFLRGSQSGQSPFGNIRCAGPIKPAFQTQEQWNSSRSKAPPRPQSHLGPMELPGLNRSDIGPRSQLGNNPETAIQWHMNGMNALNDSYASLGPLELPRRNQSSSSLVPTPLRRLHVYQTPIQGSEVTAVDGASSSSSSRSQVIPLTPEFDSRLEASPMIDELEDNETLSLTHSFDPHPRRYQDTDTEAANCYSTPIRSVPQGRIRGKLRLKQYSPTERDAKVKNFSRAMNSITTRLDQVAELHPDAEFLFYVRTKGKRNVLSVSKGLRGIDSTSWFTVIHNAMDRFSGNNSLLPVVTFKERYPQDMPMVSYSAAWIMFEETQTVRSMKALYFTLQSKGMLRVRVGSPQLTWYLESYKTLFDASSPHSAKSIWDTLTGIQFYGSMGNGKQFRELTRDHYIGLLKSLDLLAAARSEPKLPRSIDFAGNFLPGEENLTMIDGGDSELPNINFESDVQQSELSTLQQPMPFIQPNSTELNNGVGSGVVNDSNEPEPQNEMPQRARPRIVTRSKTAPRSKVEQM